MQKRFNVSIPLACPHCLIELVTTMEDIEQQQTMTCSACGTHFELKPEEHLPLGATRTPPAEQVYHGIEFF